MKLNEAIEIMRGNKTKTQLAKEIGYLPGAFATMMKRNNAQVKTLVALAESCGYEVVIMPKNEKKTERMYVIDDAINEFKEEKKEADSE